MQPITAWVSGRLSACCFSGLGNAMWHIHGCIFNVMVVPAEVYIATAVVLCLKNCSPKLG